MFCELKTACLPTMCAVRIFSLETHLKVSQTERERSETKEINWAGVTRFTLSKFEIFSSAGLGATVARNRRYNVFTSSAHFFFLTQQKSAFHRQKMKRRFTKFHVCLLLTKQKNTHGSVLTNNARPTIT